MICAWIYSCEVRWVAHPVHSPRRSERRGRRFWPGWLVVLLVLLLPAVGAGGYVLGKQAGVADIWDPLWLRVYQDRPIDTLGPSPGFWIAGYYVDHDRASLDVARTRAVHMDQLVAFSYQFDWDGSVVGKDPLLLRGLTAPEKRVLLFSNLTQDGFDRALGHRILTDEAVQERAILGILEKVSKLDAAGVQIDFENLDPDDRDAYTAFLTRLAEVLDERDVTLSVAAAAKTSDTRTGWGGATDYAAIGQVVDYFFIMAYDEHWSGGEPGPVASLPWTENVIRYATGVMPAQKIILGVPFYGYDWPADPGAGASGRAYGSARMAERMAELGAEVTWDPVAGENVALFQTEEGDRIAWYPDERSLEAKLRLAYQYNLKGIVAWRLGLEDGEWWNLLGSFRVNPEK